MDDPRVQTADQIGLEDVRHPQYGRSVTKMILMNITIDRLLWTNEDLSTQAPHSTHTTARN